MTIFVDDVETSLGTAKRLVAEKNEGPRNDLLSTWSRSGIDHRFENKGALNKAVRRNLRTLLLPQKIEELFTAENYLFSTKAPGRKETLYFMKRGDINQTGRLRQQHRKGPLAKIDKVAKTHKFLTPKRFKEVKKRYDKCKCLVRFKGSENQLRDGKYHLDFTFDLKKAHFSDGTIRVHRRDIEPRINVALKQTLGIVVRS